MSKSFETLTEAVPNTVLIVDSLNLSFRWKHQGAIFFKDEFIRTVESLKKSYKCSQVIILADHGSSSYRKAIYPDYKQNRKDKQALQTPEEAAYFEKFFEEFIRIIEHYQTETKYPTFRFKGVEADDIAGHIVANLENYGFETAWLVSSDRDWDLLVNPQVSRFSYVTRKEVTYDNWAEHYECTQEQYISIKCLMGDTGDNVPGVVKIGPKTAQKLVDQYGSALDIAANLPLPGKYVYIKNLNEFGKDNLIRNYQLMDLVSFSDEAVGPENIEIIKNELQRSGQSQN
jgi:DNA polymerase-1